MKTRRVYLDYAATTPLSQAAFLAMQPFFTECFGNANSLHGYGAKAAVALKEARRTIAACIGAKPNEILFTCGGTESNNWAVKGIAAAARLASQNAVYPPHIVVSNIEHPSVMQSANRLLRDGFRVTFLPVDRDGLVSPDALEQSILPNTCLVSVMLANNEIGTIQPIAKLAAIAKAQNVLFHTDAVQAAGTLELNVDKLGVDLMTLSAHKFFGPKGIGALYLKSGTRLRPIPLFDGGKQEYDLRGGTSNVAAAVGMASALTHATTNLKANYDKVQSIRDQFVAQITAKIPNIRYNGSKSSRLPQNANFSFLGIDADVMLSNLDIYGIAAASGSACSSGSREPSHVLTALGVSDEAAQSAIRFSFSTQTSPDDVDYTVRCIQKIVQTLRP